MYKSHQRRSTSRPRLFAVVKSVVSMLAILVLSSVAAANDDDEDWLKDSLSGDHENQQFVAGERVEVTNANVADDIFAAGNDLKFDTVSAKLIVAAGASLWFRDVTADDLILAGGQMDLSGEVRDDIVAAVCPVCPVGGRLHLTDSMQIGDDARLVGREIVIDGRVGGDLFAAAQHFELSGNVAGDARIEAENIVLESGSRIDGDLRYAGPAEPEMRDGAIVAGQIIRVESTIPFDQEVPEHAAWYGVFGVIGFLLALVLLGVALQLAMPGLLSSAAATVGTGLWASLGRGLVLALLGPAAIVALMVTVIGAPIGLVGLATLFLLYVLAFVTITYSVGLYARRLFGKTDLVVGAGSRILWTATGIVVLIIVGLVPFIGWAIGVLAIICGLGAVVSQLGPVFRKS